MKKKLTSVIGLLFILASACNTADKKNETHSDHSAEAPKTTADSLMADVMDGHDVGMGKMGKLNAMQNEVQRVLDSIGKLPAKAQGAATLYKTKLSSVMEELKSATNGMNKWMDEFNMDSAVNNMEQRIKYLTDEKMKVSKVKESILGSLQKADSLIKAKF